MDCGPDAEALVRIVLLGPPGAGKGSLAVLCHQRLRLEHLSPGEIFRQEIARQSGLGRRVKRYVVAGRLVPNELVLEVMASRLTPQALEKGFVLDGFPRTQGQAAGLDRVLQQREAPLDGAVYLTSPTALLIRRLSGRRVCPKCGANYHLLTMRPKRVGQCDRCRMALVTRKDDQPETIKKRLAVDQKAASPLLNYYRRRSLLHPVDGRGLIGPVFARAMRLFRRHGWVEDLIA